jgi:hypothetical protein
LREKLEVDRDGDSLGNRETVEELGGGAWQRAAEDVKMLQRLQKAKAKTLFFNNMNQFHGTDFRYSSTKTKAQTIDQGYGSGPAAWARYWPPF